MAEQSLDQGRVQRLKADNNLRVFSGDGNSIFWELVKGAPLPIGETDEVVTVDVKRVIRWVGSLHGKCGLRVTELPLSSLDPDSSHAFDPLNAAVASPGGNSMKVELTSDDVIARISDSEVDGSTGDVFEVPESMATFLSLKGWGNVQSM